MRTPLNQSSRQRGAVRWTALELGLIGISLMLVVVALGAEVYRWVNPTVAPAAQLEASPTATQTIGEPPITIDKQASTSEVTLGQVFSYTLTITSNSDIERPIDARVNIDGQVEVIGLEASTGTCNIENAVVCNLPLQRGQAATVKIDVRVRDDATVGNRIVSQAQAQDGVSNTAASEQVFVDIIAPDQTQLQATPGAQESAPESVATPVPFVLEEGVIIAEPSSEPASEPTDENVDEAPSVAETDVSVDPEPSMEQTAEASADQDATTEAAPAMSEESAANSEAAGVVLDDQAPTPTVLEADPEPQDPTPTVLEADPEPQDPTASPTPTVLEADPEPQDPTATSGLLPPTPTRQATTQPLGTSFPVATPFPQVTTQPTTQFPPTAILPTAPIASYPFPDTENTPGSEAAPLPSTSATAPTMSLAGIFFSLAMTLHAARRVRKANARFFENSKVFARLEPLLHASAYLQKKTNAEMDQMKEESRQLNELLDESKDDQNQ
jgi:hypothetical protein